MNGQGASLPSALDCGTVSRCICDADHIDLASISINRGAVVEAAKDLDELRQGLLAEGPVSVRGVAQTQVLLTTGSGPLY
jgi:hypothetical protein